MSSLWPSKLLGEVCKIKPPKKEAKNRLMPDDHVSFVPMANLGVCEKDLELDSDRPLSEVYSGYTYFAEGDVLLAKITPCFENGKLGIASGLTNEVGFGSSEFMVLRPSDSLDAEYLFYFLSQQQVRDDGKRVMTGAVGHKRVPVEYVENLLLPLPTLPEQKRIVAMLDEAIEAIDKAIANTEKNLANARELFQTNLDEKFRGLAAKFKLVSVSDICELENGDRGSNYPSKKTLVASGVPFVNAGHLNQFSVDTEKMTFITPEHYHLLRSGKFFPGDILFCLRGSLGKFGVVPENITEGAIASSLVIVRPKSELQAASTGFLRLYFQSDCCAEMIKTYAGGAAQPNLGAKDLAKFLVPLPSLEEQREIVKNLDELFADTQCLESLYKRKLLKLAMLKNSFLHQAFSGQGAVAA